MKHILLISAFLLFSLTCLSQVSDKKQFIKDWITQHQDVKIISQEIYDRYNEGERLEFNALTKKIVYSGSLKLEDIEKFENEPNDILYTNKK